MAKFLSEEWIKEYAKIWNNNEDLKNDLKKFSATIKYYIEGESQPPVYIKVEKGEVVEAGLAPEGKYNFEMWATKDNWKTLATGGMGPKAAMLTKKLNFKGSMITAMKFMAPFEKSLKLMGEVPTTWD